MLILPTKLYLNILVKVLLQKYFTKECSYIISEDIFMDLNFNQTGLMLNFHNSNVDLRDPLYIFGCQYFIVYSNQPRRILEYIEHTIYFTETTKFQKRRYLFIPISDYLDNIFESETLEYIAEVLLIKTIVNEGFFELVTHKYVGVDGHKDEILLDKWFYGNETFLFGVDLYPDKFKDQMGRILRICTFDYKPYINIDSEIGIELMMAKEYTKLRNMSTRLVLETDYWGVINETAHTANGAKGTMMTDGADVSLGSWYPLPNYTKHFDLTEPTVRIGVTFLVPIPKLSGGWFTPFLTFSPKLWIGFIVSYFAITTCFFGCNYTYKLLLKHRKPDSLKIFTNSLNITTVTLFLQQPMTLFLLPKFAHFRLNLTILLILSLIYAAAYTGGFAAVLTVPMYERGIRNSEDFEKSGLKWGAVHPALLDGFRDLAKYQNIVKNIVILKDEKIGERMKLHGFAMIADRAPNVEVLLQKYFTQECSYIISEDIFMDLNVNQTAIILNFHNSNVDLRDPLYIFGCQYFIVYSNQPRRILEYIEHTIYFTVTTKFQRRRYLFIPITDYLDNIFESEALEYIAEILLIRPIVNEGFFELVTHKYVGVDGHKDEILLDKWFYGNETFLFGVDLYPDKIKNQMGRIMRICTFDFKPYINIDSEIGIELMMAKEFAKLRNMSTRYVLETDYWGEINDTAHTGNGAVGTMMTGGADISIGSWYPLPNYSIYFDLTEHSIRIGVTFLVPVPKLAGGWFTPLITFSPKLWIGFVVSYVAITACFFGCNYTYKLLLKHRKPDSLKILTNSLNITSVTLFLQQPMTLFLLPKFAYFRLNLTILLILSLIYAAAYTGGFAAVLTVPMYERGIRNSEDFEKSGLKWGALHPALLDGFRDVEKYQNVVKNILILKEQKIRERMKSHGFAILADRVSNGLVVGNKVDANDVKYYRTLDDDLVSFFCVLLVRKSSILIPTIRKEFLAMKEGGLPYIWELQAFFEENYKAQIALKLKGDSKQFVNLDWRDVQGIFGIFAIGILAATVCFLCEIIANFR